MIEPVYRPLRDRMLGRTPSGDSNYSSTNGTTIAATATTISTTNSSAEGEGVMSLEELPQQVFPMVRYLGIHVSQNIVLYVKLCRLLVEFKSRFPGEKGVRVVETMLSMSLLPGVTLIPANPGVVNELWEVLKTLPYLSRFKLYGKWKNFHYETYPPLIMAKELATKEIKRIMRRLSKENVRQLGRMLGKVSHNNPIVIFSHIIDQIEAYDNLILPVADAVKYVTNLSYDILSCE
jgi:THO complex subunit 2